MALRFVRRDNVVDDYHGTQVPDPYRWLEDAGSPDTKAWSASQNDRAVEYLTAIPERAGIRDRLEQLWNYERYGPPVRSGPRYFFFKNNGLQNQAPLYVQASLDDEPALVLDPNSMSSDGTVALENCQASDDGHLVAYSCTSSGSDWQEIRVHDVDTGREYEDILRWCKFTEIAWQKDSSGFYYSRFPDPATVPPGQSSYNNTVYFHRVGSDQAADALVYQRPDAPEMAFSPHVSRDGDYLYLVVWQGTDTRTRFYCRRMGGTGEFSRVLDDFDAMYEPVGNAGSTFYFHTDLSAPRGRIIAIDVERPERAAWREVVPENEDVIAQVKLIGGRLVVVYMHHAHHRIALFGLDGKPAGEIALPGIGSLEALSGRPEDSELFFAFSSFLYPRTVFRYDFADRSLTRLHPPALAFDAEKYETRQVFYQSRDGTTVPMFITHRKGFTLDGDNPTQLYGYGGFNISETPSFAVSNLIWLELGGVLAVACLRGGGEYGEEWHRAGMLEKKQNVFDDFIAAGEWLIANGYTRSSRLAVRGGSNGGLLVATCMLQRPDLFGAVVCQVPVADMLRYHRFTVGRYWVSEYGNAEEHPEHFRFLYACSPLHNVREGQPCPPVLLTTADSDDRVAPLHAKKLTATLQEKAEGENPILLRVETKAGHGHGKPTDKQIEEAADLTAFLVRALGM